VLNEEQRRQLLRLARTSIESTLDGRTPEMRAEEFDEDLRRPAGAFVTLRKDGDLRGCIGSIRAMEPLYRAVASSAISAAFRDPRFFPVRKDEIGHLELEISVMGPIEQVRDVNEIEVGHDGLIISRGRFAGLLLPQVASEYGWDRETFLDQTCLKAGLQPNAWRSPDTRIEKFAAEVFGE
jgi:AmmeMemoRadiSam system protein A